MFAAKLKAAVLGGNVSQAVLDDKVYRVLLSMFAIGLFENNSVVARNHGQQNANVTSEAHNEVARELAVASTVLLKNEGAVLPLQLSKLSRIAVIGGAAAHEGGGGAPINGEPAGFPISGGGGSGSVMPPYQISVLQAVRGRAAASGLPASAVSYLNGSDPAAAAALAAQSDIAIVVVAVTSSEGSDRTDLSGRADLMLPHDQSAYVQAVAKAQKATVVVAISPGALLTLVCPPPPPPPPPPKLKGCTVDSDTDYFMAPCADGGCGQPAKTLQECCDQCRAIPSCHSWTWTGACPGCSPPMFCWHKKNASGRTTHKDLFSGNCSGGEGSAQVEEDEPQAPPNDDGCVDWADSVAGTLSLSLSLSVSPSLCFSLAFGLSPFAEVACGSASRAFGNVHAWAGGRQRRCSDPLWGAQP